MSESILDASLVPSQRYQVSVRSLLATPEYKGIPSEWTDPVEWTSHEGIHEGIYSSSMHTNIGNANTFHMISNVHSLV